MSPTRQVPRWRVLLVDDSFSTRELLSMILGCQGCIVSTASNGVEAIEKLNSHERPDVILLDLRMPVMDGWTLSECLERDERFATIPVVVLSCLVDEQDAKLRDAPFLHKPVDTSDLLHAIEATCGRKREAAVVA